VDLPFQATASQKIMSQYVLRLLKYKNQSKYTSQTLKSAVIMAFKREKLFRKADQDQSENTLKWIKKISAMDIDEIIQSYCKKSDVSRLSPIPSSPP
jgi:transcription termination factor NusB